MTRAIPVLLLALALPLAGCGNGNDGRALRVDSSVDPTPLVAQSTRLGLTALDGEGQVVPGLAQSWRVSDDGLSIVFRLRRASFANGMPVTAAQAVAAVQAARTRRAHPFFGLLAGVTAISAPLDDVIEMRLTTPQPELLALLAAPELAVLPPARNPPALGPFMPAGDEAGVITLGRNPRFHATADVPLDRVTLRRLDATAAIAGFARGESDLVLGGLGPGINDARTSPAAAGLRLEPARATAMLLVNMTGGPLKDLRVRRALSLAIDRQTLGSALFGSAAARPVYGLAPEGLASFPETFVPDWAGAPLVARQEDARRLLSEAGFGAERPLALTVAIPDDALSRAMAARIGNDLAAIGVTLSADIRDPAFHASTLARGGYALALTVREAPTDSPLALLLPLRCGANPAGVCLKEADRLLAQSWRAASLSARAGHYAQAERLWAEDGAVIGLVTPLRWALVSPRVAGWVDNAAGAHPLAKLDLLPEGRLFK
ncbi:ABC transporter substrate-binding protein [Sandaracinobacteroides saxicola]|uniref:ABC transporter substrate-binding protein n=1 Tax=Sandaracinobacteroides saxicola TaxID=2759707 RepID=A0A7G5IHR5_9SPHN|nr:ABC transporter substrate-binding protein [Sandaracinobacteroides saxicola]QMW22907.1 ABC transporter substrate-binding protein [Sandaracinobacteroides saxicola]